MKHIPLGLAGDVAFSTSLIIASCSLSCTALPFYVLYQVLFITVLSIYQQCPHRHSVEKMQSNDDSIRKKAKPTATTKKGKIKNLNKNDFPGNPRFYYLPFVSSNHLNFQTALPLRPCQIRNAKWGFYTYSSFLSNF